MRTVISISIRSLSLTSAALADDEGGRDVAGEIAALDARVFGDGFNDCRLDSIRDIVAEDLEFYHDLGGPLMGRDAFIDSLETNICGSPFRPRRELVADSLDVFALYSNGALYGALETGTHRFYERESEHPDDPTGIAQFTILWLLQNDHWQMSRVVSYDHQAAD